MKISAHPVLHLLAPFFLLTWAQQAMANNSSANVFLTSLVTSNSASDFQTDSATPATATLLDAAGNVVATGNAKSELATGSVGLGIDILAVGASSYGGYSANARWDDAWTISGSSPFASVTPTYLLNGSLSTSLLSSTTGFWELSFKHYVDNNLLFSFVAFSDGAPATFTANANGTDISSSVILTSNATTGLTDFYLLSTAASVAFPANFTDSIVASLIVDSEGPISIDAFHSFHVNLGSDDPNVILSDEGGRSSVPLPETYVLFFTGLSLLGYLAHRRQQKHSTVV